MKDVAQNFANLLSRYFQSNEPFDDDEESEAEEDADAGQNTRPS